MSLETNSYFLKRNLSRSRTASYLVAVAWALLILSTLGSRLLGAASQCSPQGFRVSTVDANASPRGVAVVDFNRDGLDDVAVVDSINGNVTILLGRRDKSFVAPRNYPVTSVPYSVATAVLTADFNGDGKLDLVVTTSYHSISVLMGNGDGTFQNEKEYDVVQSVSAVALGDFNRDGKMDLALAGDDATGVVILLGNGDGSFKPPVIYPIQEGGNSIAVGDFNGDGRLDVVTLKSGWLWILQGNGDGTFQPARRMVIEASPSYVRVLDVNRDGKDDLAVWGYFGGVGILLGNGDGTFQAPLKNYVGDVGNSVIFGDFNGDGKTDLAVGFQGGIAIFLGTGNGTFNSAGTYAGGILPGPGVSGDFDGDGKTDLLTSGGGLYAFASVLFGHGDGTFDSWKTLGAKSITTSVAVGDFDRDGKPDMAAAHQYGDIGVMKGNGDGTFQVATNPFLSHQDISTLLVGDFNRDGLLDLVASNNFGFAIHLGKGDGTFLPPILYRVGLSNGRDFVANDFNGDGLSDIAIGDFSLNAIAIFLGNGDGTFQTARYTPNVSDRPLLLVTEDFNGDGRPDIAVETSGDISLLFGNGDGTFQSPVTLARGSFASVVAADLNNDGKIDLVASFTGPFYSLGIWLGRGDGTFSAMNEYDFPKSVGWLVIADYDRDGKPDVVFVNDWKSEISFLHGNGDGTLAPRVIVSPGEIYVYAVTADVTADGAPDFLFEESGLGATRIAVLTNSCPPPSNCPAIMLASAPPQDGEAGKAYTYTLTATGGVPFYHFNVREGALPPGLTLSPSGVVSGTPTRDGVYTFTIATTDSNGCIGNMTLRIKVGSVQTTTVELPLQPGGAATTLSEGSNPTVQAGYATVTVNSGNAPQGLAVFSLTQNGVVVSEAAVPAVPLTTHARIFIDYRAPGVSPVSQGNASGISVNTGLALVNPGTSTANLTLQLRDSKGTALAQGQGALAAGAHQARFIDQLGDIAPDFKLSPDFGTAAQFCSLEITSTQPLALTALRLTTNQRGESLITTTPIVDLTRPSAPGPLFYPQMVDGNGYTTSLFLLNSSSAIATGVVKIFNDRGEPQAIHRVDDPSGAAPVYSYRIVPGGVFALQSDGSPSVANTGSIQIIPDPGSPTPSGAGIFGFTAGGILVSETGVPLASPTTHARIYIDRSRGHNTGLALAAPDGTPLRITLNALGINGFTMLGSGSEDLVGYGHAARFANEFIPLLPDNITGILDIAAPSPFLALTLRLLVNGKGDTLLTTFPVAGVNDSVLPPLYFPQIVNGGGYQTEVILLSTSGGASTTVSFHKDDGSPMSIGKSVHSQEKPQK